MSGRVALSVIIPTFNEELNLPGCLASIREWADEVFVVDSFSSDGTGAVAARDGAHFVQHRFEGYAQQKNWALDELPIRNQWILILDADERMSRELRDEVAGLIAAGGNGFDGFYLNRRFMFYGKWIRHCGWYPSWNLRLFRRSAGRYEIREVHEHVLLQGRAGYCRHDMIHEDLRDMEFWIAKHNRYSSQEARELRRAAAGKGGGLKPSFFGGPLERKRFIKERIWRRLPARGFVYFAYLYFFRLGFLDGYHGFMFCRAHAIFEEMSVLKAWEMRQSANGMPDGAKSAATPRP